MGYLSPTHLLLLGILLVVVFIIWGPGKLPDVGAGLGRAIREFRKASSETREEFSRAAHPEQHHGDAGAAQPHTVADPAAPREPTAPEAAAVPASGAPAEPAPSGGGTVLGPPPDTAR